jgi:hypothetical protein
MEQKKITSICTNGKQYNQSAIGKRETCFTVNGFLKFKFFSNIRHRTKYKKIPGCVEISTLILKLGKHNISDQEQIGLKYMEDLQLILSPQSSLKKKKKKKKPK